MTNGYLINAREIIKYARWYLSNPIQKFHQRETHKKSPAFSQARNLLKSAVKHPDMVAFWPTIYEATKDSLKFDDGNFIQIGKYDFDPVVSSNEYLNELKSKTVVNFKSIADFAEKANKINNHRNVRRIAWNRKCNAIIIKLAKSSPKPKHIPKNFLDPYETIFNANHPTTEDSMPVDCRDFYDEHLSSLYPDTIGHEFLDDYNTPKISSDNDPRNLHDRETRIGDEYHDISVDQNRHVYLYGDPVGLSCDITYWLARKVRLMPIIKINKLRKEPAFTDDIHFYDIVDTAKSGGHLSNQHEIVDYERFVANRQTVKD